MVTRPLFPHTLSKRSYTLCTKTLFLLSLFVWLFYSLDSADQPDNIEKNSNFFQIKRKTVKKLNFFLKQCIQMNYVNHSFTLSLTLF